ncbi:MAG: TlpA family protein disulfide reductase, partial [Polaribacter sp.]
ISKSFKKRELKNIKYEYLFALSGYENYHRYLTKNKDFKVSEGFLKELKDPNLDNESDFLFSPSYRSLVASKLKEKASKVAKKNSISEDIAYLNVVVALKSEKIKNKLLFDHALSEISYTNNIKEYYSIFSKNSTNKENNKKIAAKYNKLKVLAQGNPSPKFIDFEDNAGGTKSLDHFKGKYVYIDVWATWCGPCMDELPSLKKVEAQYHGKNISFISISIDKSKDHKKWKKMIVDKKLGGTQLLADNEWKSKFVQDFGIKGIPRFILLDPKGNIVRSHAPRPSDKKLIELFEELKI